MKKQGVGVLVTVIASVLFGFSFLFTKEAVDRVSPLTLLSWRFIIALLLMSALAAAGVFKLNLRGKKMGGLILMALFQPILYFVGETVGVEMTTASESGAIIAVIPIVVLLFSNVFLKERPMKLQVIGIIASVAGVMCIVLMKGFSASFNVLGYAMLFLAVLGDATYVIISRKAAEFTSVEKTYIMAAMGAVVFSGAAIVEHSIKGTLMEYITLPFVDMEFLKAVLYLALGCQVLAFVLYNYGIGIIGASRSTSFAGVTTLTSVLSGVILLGEDFSLIQGVGTLLILGGAYIANIIPKNAQPLPAEALDELKYRNGAAAKAEEPGGAP